MMRFGTKLSVLWIVWAGFISSATAKSLQVDLVDRGKYLLIEVKGGVPADKSVRNYSDRIEIDLVGAADTHSWRFRDRTVKRVDIVGKRPSRLSVQLRHGRKKTAAIARHASFTKNGQGMTLRIQRYGYFQSDRFEKQQHEQLKELEALEQVETSSIATPVGEKPQILEDQEKRVPVSLQLEPEQPISASVPPSHPPAKSPALARSSSAQDSSGIGAGLVITLVLLIGCAALAWYVKRNRTILVPENTLDVVASRIMGSKSKISLLNAGERQFLLAVNDKGVHLLSQWRRSHPTTSKLGGFGSETKPETMPAKRPRSTYSSPAVAGLVALRSRSDVSAVHRGRSKQ